MDSDNGSGFEGYQPGDTFSYLSTSSMEIVTWTRDEQGLWHCDDGREMAATDADVAFNSAHNVQEQRGHER